jgi:hypothetical protein
MNGKSVWKKVLAHGKSILFRLYFKQNRILYLLDYYNSITLNQNILKVP